MHQMAASEIGEGFIASGSMNSAMGLYWEGEGRGSNPEVRNSADTHDT